MKYSDLVNNFEEGIFEKLNNKKVELEKQGKTIYDLFVGTPDFKPDNYILNEISKRVLDPELMKYSLRDMDLLKKRFIKHYKDRFNVILNENIDKGMNNNSQNKSFINLSRSTVKLY